MAAHLLDARPQDAVPRRGERARDHIGMAVQILRRRVHHDVGAERERLVNSGVAAVESMPRMRAAGVRDFRDA